MAAEGLRVKSAAVSIMLRKLRIEKLSETDVSVMESVLASILSENDSDGTPESIDDDIRKTEPDILILQRNRNK